MYLYPKDYDVVVVGSGHAGIEAALAAGRLGCATALITQNLDTIGQMSCNPAIGGLGKGHMVREIDALGGVMAENTDATGIQFRMLNQSRGPSVQAPRVQCDKKAYQFRLKNIIENQENLDLYQDAMEDIQVNNDAIHSLTTRLGIKFRTKTLILSAGTFMRGLLHVGLNQQHGGRMGDTGSAVSLKFQDLGFVAERFKTGTPARLLSRSINFQALEKQEGDTPPPHCSFLWRDIAASSNQINTLNNWADPLFHVEQMPCWLGYTNSKTHDLIRGNLDQSPMYTGVIEGTGPRYCPSIEDKVMRFQEKERHQVFIEPEGRDTGECYVNGVSTSLPYSVQYAFLRSIPGLENCQIIRPGYAVEYDYFPPTQLLPSLETKKVQGLFFAGQINGTSGYEEAAAQGLIAGINAALRCQGKPAYVPSRAEAYIGVMLDDLVTKGVSEPYRMFTSRAEYRLLLRQDNADQRLTPASERIGLATARRSEVFQNKLRRMDTLRQHIASARIECVSLHKWLARPGNSWVNLPKELQWDESSEIWKTVQTEISYAGYLSRQEEAITKVKRMEQTSIDFVPDFTLIRGLKPEAAQSLQKLRPSTLGQAGRLRGVSLPTSLCSAFG